MVKIHSVSWAIDGLKHLSQDPYSPLWKLIEDFECNGHIISVKRSNQWNHVIIDDVYYCIGGVGKIQYRGQNYSYLEYIEKIVLA